VGLNAPRDNPRRLIARPLSLAPASATFTLRRPGGRVARHYWRFRRADGGRGLERLAMVNDDLPSFDWKMAAATPNGPYRRSALGDPRFDDFP
jgi:hypothetical protein